MATAVLGATCLVFRVVFAAFADDPLVYLTVPTFFFHALGVVFPFGIWLANRHRARSLAFVHATEVIGFLGSAIAYTAMGAYVVPAANPVSIVLLVLTYSAVARAAYVPSTPRRTLLLTGVISIPLAGLALQVSQATPLDLVAQVMGDYTADPNRRDFVIFGVVSTAVWWLLTTMLAAGISHVIYGLQREVRDIKRLGQYTLEEQLGEGGMGIVFRARHALLRRPTAVKLLPPDRAGATAIARFEREVQLTALLTHPNTVTIFDYGRTPDNVFYYAMELLDGATLSDIVAVGGAQPPARVIKVLAEVAGALDEAHGVGLIHRDIKPENILLARVGGVPDVSKVVDFGLVKDVEHDSDLSLTAHDTITGTPQYMAPEAITAPESVDGRSDLYALGAVGYFLLTGHHVFAGKTIVEIASHHLHSEPEPPSARLGRPVPADLEALLLDCLAKKPDDRPPTAADMLARIEGCEDVGHWSRRDAEAWWSEHASALKKRRRQIGDSKPLTIEIDTTLREKREAQAPVTRRA
jgi:serine/threonine protein kinase